MPFSQDVVLTVNATVHGVTTKLTPSELQKMLAGSEFIDRVELTLVTAVEECIGDPVWFD